MTNSTLDVGSTRRHFFQDCGVGVGKIALASLLASETQAASEASTNPTALKPTHFPATAKRVIYLFQSRSMLRIFTFSVCLHPDCTCMLCCSRRVGRGLRDPTHFGWSLPQLCLHRSLLPLHSHHVILRIIQSRMQLSPPFTFSL